MASERQTVEGSKSQRVEEPKSGKQIVVEIRPLSHYLWPLLSPDL